MRLYQWSLQVNKKEIVWDGGQDQDQLAADLQDRLTLTKKRTQRKIDNYAQYPTNRTPEDTLHLLCREADLNPPLNRARK